MKYSRIITHFVIAYISTLIMYGLLLYGFFATITKDGEPLLINRIFIFLLTVILYPLELLEMLMRWSNVSAPFDSAQIVAIFVLLAIYAVVYMLVLQWRTTIRSRS